jgi:hypothetical protein
VPLLPVVALTLRGARAGARVTDFTDDDALVLGSELDRLNFFLGHDSGRLLSGYLAVMATSIVCIVNISELG